jgi:hypothetical protein
MRSTLSHFLLIISAITLFTCKKDDDPDTRTYPRINTIGVTDVNEEGATFEAEITSLGIYGITDHGFVWDGTFTPTLSANSGKQSLGPATKTGLVRLSTQSRLIAGRKYYVRPYITDGKSTMYGKVMTFISLGGLTPKILSFTPESGVRGDTITIAGLNFGNTLYGVEVKFGSEAGTLISILDKEIKVVVPNQLPTLSHKLSFRVGEQTITAGTEFSLLTPTLSSFSPQMGKPGDIITIRGNNFGKGLLKPEVAFGVIKAEIKKFSNTEIQVLVPASQYTSSTIITVNIVDQSISFPNEFFIQTAWTRKADFEGSIYPKLEYAFSISNKAYIWAGSDFWEYDANNDQWTAKANFPGEIRESIVSFSINGKGYAGTGRGLDFQEARILNDFWEYDPLMDKWTRKADVGGGIRTDATGFSIGSKGYIGIGRDNNEHKKDFWEYNPQSDKWTQKKDFAGGNRYRSVGFNSLKKGYIGGGISFSFEWAFDLWEYSPIDDTWLKKSSTVPIILDSNLERCSIGDKQYFQITTDSGALWEYNTLTNQWSKIDFFPESDYFQVMFPLNEKIYAAIKYYRYQMMNELWEFDPSQ